VQRREATGGQLYEVDLGRHRDLLFLGDGPVLQAAEWRLEGRRGEAVVGWARLSADGSDIQETLVIGDGWLLRNGSLMSEGGQ
jgi:hypothetical protein